MYTDDASADIDSHYIIMDFQFRFTSSIPPRDGIFVTPVRNETVTTYSSILGQNNLIRWLVDDQYFTNFLPDIIDFRMQAP